MKTAMDIPDKEGQKRLVKQGLIVNLDGKGTYAHARVCVC